MLEAAGADFANVVVFHSLSKRSSLPGLRVGFAAGDRKFLARISRIAQRRRAAGADAEQHVAIAAYGDETHVEENRRLYREKFDLADQIIGDRYGYRASGRRLLPLARRVGARRQRSRGAQAVARGRLARRAGSLSRARAGRRQQSRAQITFASPWCRTRRSPPRRCTASSRCWAKSMRRCRDRSTRQPATSLDMDFLSGQLGAVLQRRLREAAGIALISLAMMAALALATWSVQDPSLSHATDAPVHNLLGMPGAIVADLLMQLLGLGSLALLLPIAVWGYRLLGHRPLSRERLRMLLWLVGAVLDRGVCIVPAAQRALAAAVRTRRRDRRRHAAAAGGAAACAAVGDLPFHQRRSCSASRRLSLSPSPQASSGVATTERSSDEADTKRTTRKKPRTRTATSAPGSRSACSPHALLSLRARIALLVPPRGRLRRSRPSMRCRRQRIEPRFGKRAQPLAGERSRDRRRRTPTKMPAAAAQDARPAPRRNRARAAAAATPCRRSNLLTAPRAGERTTVSAETIRENARRARRRARRFRRARRDHQCAAGPGGHALRARARARHQILARDRPRRRHRALDERAVRARRRGVGPQRHRHRAAEPDAREGLSARAAGRRATTPTRGASCRSASARRSAANRCSSISRACRIC